jgi:hypothetical protein
MLAYSVLLACLAPVLAATCPDPNGLPPCDTEYRPCRCPAGATFKNLTSFGVIGAPAIEVRNIMGKCKYNYSITQINNVTFQVPDLIG